MAYLHITLQLLVAAAYFASALRLACFRRGDSCYRLGISLLASFIGAALFIAGLEILLDHTPVTFWQAIGVAFLAYLVFRSRGNVAALLRPIQ